MCLEVPGQLSKTAWMKKAEFFFFKIDINSYSVIKCRECSHGMQEVLGLNSGRALYFNPHPFPVTFGDSMRVRAPSSKGTVLSRWYLHGSEQIWGRIYLSRGKLSWVDRLAQMLAWHGRVLGSSPGLAMYFFLLCISSMTSFDVKVIEINTITQDSVPAYKKDHAGVGAKITQELLHILSHYLLRYSGFVLKFHFGKHKKCPWWSW